ncbi:DUF3592 domain-containing protein [Nocardia otitidiscaviarum]|uniref:DUF3592 domain-containing protein n=1 Tax=Nocardia otitidiscaviarum TaxID=1823 RepID=UPI00245609C7|nr:DUF3592 domain-containing protein [Nocardia otitidiscaviarum]
MQQSTTGHRVFTLLCTLAGTILIALAAASAGNRALFLAESSTAQGTVVGFAGNASRSGKSLLVEFTTTSGKRIRIEGGVSVTSRGHTHGDTVTVRYDPQHPNHALLDAGFLSLFYLQLFFGALGMALLLIGLRYMTAAPTRRRVQHAP